MSRGAFQSMRGRKGVPRGVRLGNVSAFHAGLHVAATLHEAQFLFARFTLAGGTFLHGTSVGRCYLGGAPRLFRKRLCLRKRQRDARQKQSDGGEDEQGSWHGELDIAGLTPQAISLVLSTSATTFRAFHSLNRSPCRTR